MVKIKKGQVYYPLLFIFMQAKLEGSEQVFEQQASNNTTLTINKLENAFEQNENQIDLMQKFIKTKTSEIATLQEYLIGEFQNMENAKARNKRIEKLIITEAIPMLKEISLKLRQFKEYLTPFANVATSYVTALASKAQQLLAKKQEVIDQQATTIQQLQNKLLSYSKTSKQEQHQKSRSIVEQRSQDIYMPGKEWGKSNQLFQMTQKLNKLQRQFTPDRQKSIKVTYQRIQSKQTSKNPIKINKYEECYQNIQQNKKFINYRCERPLSPLQTNIDPHRRAQKNKQEYALGCQRKQCIKQKIEKIKIRTECKQKHTKFAFYENYQ